MVGRSATRVVPFKKLQASGSSASVIVRLMMACNDIQLANESLAKWGRETSSSLADRKLGAQLYFIRLQFSHLFEALDIIESIFKDMSLMAMVGRCDGRTQASFQYMQDYLRKPRGSRRSWLEQNVGQIRNNVAFHYQENGKQIVSSVERIADNGNHVAVVTRADHAHNWHFEPSDLIINNIVIRQIWKITTDDPLPEANQIIDQVHELCLKFLDFSGELIWKYTEK